MSKNTLKQKIKNPHGLHKELLDDFVDFLSPLLEADEATAAKIMAYVVDGEESDFILSLSGNSAAALALGYTRSGSTNYTHMQHLLKQRQKVLMSSHLSKSTPNCVIIRLAETLDALARAGSCAASYPSEWPSWLGCLVMETACVRAYSPTSGGKAWSVLSIEKLLQDAKLQPDLVLFPLLGMGDPSHFRTVNYYVYQSTPANQAYDDMGEYCNKHWTSIKNLFTSLPSDKRINLIDRLMKENFDFSLLLDLLAEYACGSSKVARDKALQALLSCRDKAKPLLEQTLVNGNASERHEAVTALWRLFGADTTDLLNQRLQVDNSDRVKQTIEKLLASGGQADEAIDDLQLEWQPIVVPTGELPLGDVVKEKVRALFSKAHEAQMRNYEQQLKRYEAPDRPSWMKEPGKPTPAPEEILQRIFDFVEGRSVGSIGTAAVTVLVELPNVQPYLGYSSTLAGDWAAPPAMQLIHVVRLAHALRRLNYTPGVQPESIGNYGNFWWGDRSTLDAFRSNCHPPVGLRELDAAVAALPGASSGLIARAYLSFNSKWQSFCDWEDESVWPIFAEHPQYLLDVLRPQTTDATNWHLSTQRTNAFKILSMFPAVPAHFVPLLWEIALGETKAERGLAQKALDKLPGKAPKVIVALKDGKQGVRAAAAEWLGTIKDVTAIEPLKDAFKKEKNEVVKGVIMHALDALKANVDEFLNRDELAAEAKAGLAKKLPKGAEWVPLDTLPKVHWDDTGAQVPADVVRWWVVQSVQQKSPVCGPVIRKYLSLCKKKDANQLARYILSAWIGHDTATASQEEAAAKARVEADKNWAAWSHYPHFAQSYNNDKENYYKSLVQLYSGTLINSAIDQKGMLALASASGDADCVKMSEQYIRKFFGNRLAQCKALIDVLAWLDHPLALQVLLSFANRFRTKALREAAASHVAAIAERQGWTIDELADRTIPDGGFARPVNENGEPIGNEAVLELDYGPRQFDVRLNDELEPVITVKGEGKALKAPPAPGKSDDEEKAKEAKKIFSDAKKVVKEVVKRQSERIYEALCTQRSWGYGDWYRYLAQHPVVGRLCTRVVWTAFEKDDAGALKFHTCFRPLEDGSLTDAKDEQVCLSEQHRVFVAHSCNVPAELETSWLQHFEDYDVNALFAQFGREKYELPESKKKDTEVKDFEGHCITTYKLRSKATKMGYVRGEAEDGAYFSTYRKQFVSLSMQAVIEFTGSYLPEEDIPAALLSLSFETVRADKDQASWLRSKIPLDKVPGVLLTECYNDMKQIAAEGTGYDTKWQEKSYF